MKHAVILAAGRGIRMRPLTDKIPKAMAPYKGSTLISKSIEKIKSYFDYIHITVGYGVLYFQNMLLKKELQVSSILKVRAMLGGFTTL